MSIWSSSYQQIVFKRDHSEKHLSEFYLQDGGKNQLEGKYSLESTDPRESEIRAHLRPWFSVEWSELRIITYLLCIKWFVGLFTLQIGLFTLEKIPGLRRFWTVTFTPG